MVARETISSECFRWWNASQTCEVHKSDLKCNPLLDSTGVLLNVAEIFCK